MKKHKPAAAGVRMELGVLPLKLRRQALKLLYWERLCHADPTRLLHILFRYRQAQVQQGKGSKSWCRKMRDLLVEWDLGAFWQECSASPKQEWKDIVWAHHDMRGQSANSKALEARGQSSLRYYHRVQPEFLTTPKYLEDRSNRVASLTQTRLRLGMAPLMSRLFTLLKLPAAAAMCPLCKDGTRETTEHFVLHCPSLEPERVAFLTRLRHVMQQLGTPGEHVLRSFRTDPFALLDAALGGLPQLPAGHGSLQEQRRDKELRAQTLWAFDKVVKNFVMILWRTRNATVGSYTIADKCLVHTPRTRSLRSG